MIRHCPRCRRNDQVVVESIPIGTVYWRKVSCQRCGLNVEAPTLKLAWSYWALHFERGKRGKSA